MAVFAVSDLHISGPADPLYCSLLTLIGERAKSGDTLVLVGDVFDLFVGKKAVFLERFGQFLTTVREAAARGVHVHYVEGNHDFQLGDVFGRGVLVHEREVELEVEGKKFFFAHGDLADRSDYGYRALRLFLRSRVMKSFVLAAPGGWIDGIGRRSSLYSRDTGPRLAAHLTPDDRERMRKIYRSFAAEKMAQGFDFVVLGHCHDLDEMSFTVAGRPGHYINIGFPPVHGSYVEWTPGADKIFRSAMP
jgi:UDP-2,3-diacylglucosamine hydrolase